MTHTINAMRSAILASALLGQPVLAQDRVAISVGSGEGAEILYVSPSDRRAPRNAIGTVPDVKAPVMADWVGRGEEAAVSYMELTSARANLPPAAFGTVQFGAGQRIATYVGSGESAEVVYTEVLPGQGR